MDCDQRIQEKIRIVNSEQCMKWGLWIANITKNVDCRNVTNVGKIED